MLSPGVILNGRYQLNQRIAAGGMGEVWRGDDLLLHREIAVKVLLPALMSDSDFITRFRSEARMMAALRHPGIVQVYDYGENAQVGAHRLDYLVMEYIDGTPLSARIQQAGRLGSAETMTIVAQVADALHAAHESGIIHRDVKPSNLLVRPAGAIVLVDFGVARSVGVTGITSTNVVLGSAHYMAPEQAEGRPVTAATDVYALGAVAFSCLTGRPPYVGDNPLAVLAQLVHGQPPVLPPDVPAATASVVLRALAKDPGQRFPSASALAAAARAAGSPPSSYGVSAPLPRQPGPAVAGPAASAPAPSGPAGAAASGARGVASSSFPAGPAAHKFAPGSAAVGAGASGFAAAHGSAPHNSAAHGSGPHSSAFHGSGPHSSAFHGSGPHGAAAHGAVPVGAPGEVTSAKSVKGRNATVALAAVAVVALLAGVGIILGNGSGNDDSGTGSLNAGAPIDQLQAGGGQSTGARGQASTRPGGQKSSPQPNRSAGPTGKTPTTDPAASAKPTGATSPDPGASTDPSATATNPHDDPVTICGAGYQVINSHKLKTSAGVLRGTVYVLYLASGGTNCVVTIKADTFDEKTSMSATLQVKGDAKTYADKGTFQYYAGPVTAAAPKTCIKWGGAVGGMSFESDWAHCK
ncbi:serine/threonine-protein kinase [Actinoplanes sandaracinus]|uniref:serine/threonine-protein kinase n=1 Tax=Actinoplanes sandaracinus TaxID=3045177 RepID=UPI0038995D7B